MGKRGWVFWLLATASAAQIPTDDPVKAQEAWYDREFERPDLIPGAFEVLRFPTGYQFQPRYQHDPKKRSKVLNPDWWCSECERRGIIPKDPDRELRLMDRDGKGVLGWLREETKNPGVLIEDDLFKIYSDLPLAKLKEHRNPFLLQELAELGDIFPGVDDKTAVLDGHQRAHLYLIRGHRLVRDFLWMVGHDSVASVRKQYHWLGPILGMNGKLECYLFSRQREYGAFCDEHLGRKAPDGQPWHLITDRAMMLAFHGQSRADAEVANFFAHRLMHNLIDAYRMYSFKLPAWFQMGMAHWVERRESINWNTFCYSEGVIPEVIQATRWAPRVKKMMLKGDIQPFAQMCAADEYGQLPLVYHLVTHSWVCYLWRLGPEKMPVFMNELKAKKEDETLYQAQIRAFRKAYGISINEFDAGWRAWVLEVYPDN